ncbi:MAG TPA: YfhO family protein [Thermoanaerobaculia bacterium]|nr:YfhO family protein [Thermoanaerobaculia bacterium]
MKAEGRRQKEEGRKDSFLTSAFCLLPSAFIRHLFPLALLALLATTLFLPSLIRQEVFTLRDHLDYFQPLRYFTAQELRAGNLPLWNPWNASGEEWLANPQTGVFYPPAWLFVVLPFATAYMLFLLFHLILLGWGSYLLFVRRVSPGAAMTGAAALMFSGPVLSLLDIGTILCTFAWIPLALWCARESAPVAGGLALALSFLAGEPLYAGAAALMYIAASRRVRDAAIAALVAFGVSAIQLLPFLELLAGSDRAGAIDSSQIFQHFMPLRDWPRIAVPPALSERAFDAALGQHFIPMIYMGIVAVAFALIGLTRLRAALPWLALIAIVVVVAAGPKFLASLPVMLFRYPARLVPFAALAVAALAALGWDRVRRERRWLDLIVVAAIVADLVPRALPLLQTAPFRTDIVPYAREIGAKSKILRVGDVEMPLRELWIAGYLNLYDRRFDAGTAAPVTRARYLRLYHRVVARPRRGDVDALAAGTIIGKRALRPPFQLVARTANVLVYRNPTAHPMAALHTRSGAIVPAEWELTSSRARISVDAPEEGVLVLSQQDARGWSVTVDGVPRQTRLVRGVFRGVDVPKGRHEVVWSYRSRALLAGAAMTIVTLLGATFSFCQAVKKKKNFSSCQSNLE